MFLFECNRVEKRTKVHKLDSPGTLIRSPCLSPIWSEFALADPWIGYSNSGLAGNGWSYSKFATDIFKAYNSVNIGLMY